MSLGIGLVITKNINLSDLDDLKQKYGLGLLRIENKYVSGQLLEDEMFLQATRTGCDSLSGLGAYELYSKDLSKIYQVIKDPKEARFLVEDAIKRKEIYKNDTLRWIDIINALKIQYRVAKVGLFLHSYMTSFDREEIILRQRKLCDVNDITLEYLMRIEIDTLVFFD